MSGKTFYLAHATARKLCADFALMVAPDGWRVHFSEPEKKRAQEEKYHAMVGDIAKQWPFMGQWWHQDDMKRLLVDLFAETMRQLGTPLHHDGRVVPSIDGKRVVQLGIQTREFYVKEASDFIEWLLAFGVEKNIVWSDDAKRELAKKAAAKRRQEVAA